MARYLIFSSSTIFTYGFKFGILSCLNSKKFLRITINNLRLIEHCGDKKIKTVYGILTKNVVNMLKDENYAKIYSTRLRNVIDKTNFFYNPYSISNCVVDLKFSIIYFREIAKELINLGCKSVIIKIYEYGDEYLSQLIELIELFCHVEIIISEHMNIELFVNRIFKLNLYSKIYVYNSSEHSSFYKKFSLDTRINFYFNREFDIRNCGFINNSILINNSSFYSESLHHNSCLNRKISIDAEGNIKNCPSMKESYGNIRDTTLAEAIEKPGFKKYWDINKDKIAVCKDCEFRYICTDCRAYVEDPEDASGPDGTNVSKPLKCGYNPYTGEWADWSTNPLKQKAIDFYGMREMVEEMKEKN
ncbi:MAG: hypothetical protein RLZZ546_1415 [Bacteroidota bacterium]|jgi:SPASM domain peptide maturase of grasp-with-spasm system